MGRGYKPVVVRREVCPALCAFSAPVLVQHHARVICYAKVGHGGCARYLEVITIAGCYLHHAIKKFPAGFKHNFRRVDPLHLPEVCQCRCHGLCRKPVTPRKEYLGRRALHGLCPNEGGNGVAVCDGLAEACKVALVPEVLCGPTHVEPEPCPYIVCYDYNTLFAADGLDPSPVTTFRVLVVAECGVVVRGRYETGYLTPVLLNGFAEAFKVVPLHGKYIFFIVIGNAVVPLSLHPGRHTVVSATDHQYFFAPGFSPGNHHCVVGHVAAVLCKECPVCRGDELSHVLCKLNHYRWYTCHAVPQLRLLLSCRIDFRVAVTCNHGPVCAHVIYELVAVNVPYAAPLCPCCKEGVVRGGYKRCRAVVAVYAAGDYLRRFFEKFLCCIIAVCLHQVSPHER